MMKFVPLLWRVDMMCAYCGSCGGRVYTTVWCPRMVIPGIVLDIRFLASSTVSFIVFVGLMSLR